MKGVVNYKSLHFFWFVARRTQCTLHIVKVLCVESFTLEASKMRNYIKCFILVQGKLGHNFLWPLTTKAGFHFLNAS